MVVLSCFTGAKGFCSFSSFMAALEHAAIPSLLFISPDFFSLWFLPHCLITKTSHQNEKNKYLWSSHEQHHPLWGEALGELQLSRLEEKEIKSCFFLAISSSSCFPVLHIFTLHFSHVFCPCSQACANEQWWEPCWIIPWVFICIWRGCEAPTSLVWCKYLPMDSCTSWSHPMARYLHMVIMDAVTTSPFLGRKDIISLLDTWYTLTPNPQGVGRTMTRDGRSPLSCWLRGKDISL